MSFRGGSANGQQSDQKQGKSSPHECDATATYNVCNGWKPDIAPPYQRRPFPELVSNASRFTIHKAGG